MSVTFNEIREKILASYPEAEVTQRLYNYDYHASICVSLNNDKYFFTQRREPTETEPLGAEEGETATYFMGFSPNVYPKEMVQLILITLENKIQVLHKYTGIIEELN